MKRFKDCAIFCIQGQTADELANLIKEKCIEESYKVEELTAFRTNDTLTVFLNKKEFPICRLIMSISIENGSVKIINIVPDRRSGFSSLCKELYNQILDSFKEAIFISIADRYGNEIHETSADYTIEDVIPESSRFLKIWLGAYPLSGHTHDQIRWFDFLISLVENNETLSVDDFSQYIEENYTWSDDDIERFELKYEEELALLEYYNGRR